MFQGRLGLHGVVYGVVSPRDAVLLLTGCSRSVWAALVLDSLFQGGEKRVFGRLAGFFDVLSVPFTGQTDDRFILGVIIQGDIDEVAGTPVCEPSVIVVLVDGDVPIVFCFQHFYYFGK